MGGRRCAGRTCYVISLRCSPCLLAPRLSPLIACSLALSLDCLLPCSLAMLACSLACLLACSLAPLLRCSLACSLACLLAHPNEKMKINSKKNMSPLLLLQLPLLLLLLVLFLLLLHCYCYLLVATTATPTVTVMMSTADYRYQKGLEHHSGSFLHGRSFSASAINVVSYCRDNQGHTSWLLAVSNIASLLHSS